MRLAQGRAGWALLAAGTVGLAVSAAAPKPTVPTASVAVKSEKSADATDGRGRLAEIKVELAWLTDPATFPYQLAARVCGPQLEVGGIVPNDVLRQRALQLARDQAKMPVVDKLMLVPGSAVLPVQNANGDLCRVAATALTRWFNQYPGNFEVSADASGRITVTGEVPSCEDKLTVSRRLAQMAGCTAVLNHLTVAKVQRDGKIFVQVGADGKQMVAGDPNVILPKLTPESLPQPVAVKPASSKTPTVPKPVATTTTTPAKPTSTTTVAKPTTTATPPTAKPVTPTTTTTAKPVTITPTAAKPVTPTTTVAKPTTVATTTTAKPTTTTATTAAVQRPAPSTTPVSPYGGATTKVVSTPAVAPPTALSPYVTNTTTVVQRPATPATKSNSGIVQTGATQPANAPAHSGIFAAVLPASSSEPTTKSASAPTALSKPTQAATVSTRSTPATAPAKPTPVPLASSSKPATPSKPTTPAPAVTAPMPEVIRLKQSVEQACGGKVRNVAITVTGPKCITLKFSVRNEADGQALGRMVMNLPQLAAYKVELEVGVQ